MAKLSHIRLDANNVLSQIVLLITRNHDKKNTVGIVYFNALHFTKEAGRTSSKSQIHALDSYKD